MKPTRISLAVVLWCGISSVALADEVKVAVAANFTEPMKEIAAAFEKKTRHTASVSYGSTGKFYTQIINGAPFEILLAADQKTPKLLQDGGLGSGRFTYAIGKLVLWSADPALVDTQGKVLKTGGFEKIAVANPKTAPYGTAAVQAMQARGVYAALKPKIVQGDNITQTYQFVATRNAQLGFVALSQVIGVKSGSAWQVPQALYDPIRQDAVLLKTGASSPAASELMSYLKSDDAQAVIKKYGYVLE